LKRHANKRDISEPEIVEALEKAGCTVFRMDKPVDLLVGRRNTNFLVECKTVRKQGGLDKFTEDQIKFMDSWRGGPVVVLRSAEDAINWLNVAE